MRYGSKKLLGIKYIKSKLKATLIHSPASILSLSVAADRKMFLKSEDDACPLDDKAYDAK